MDSNSKIILVCRGRNSLCSDLPRYAILEHDLLDQFTTVSHSWAISRHPPRHEPGGPTTARAQSNNDALDVLTELHGA